MAVSKVPTTLSCSVQLGFPAPAENDGVWWTVSVSLRRQGAGQQARRELQSMKDNNVASWQAPVSVREPFPNNKMERDRGKD